MLNVHDFSLLIVRFCGLHFGVFFHLNLLNSVCLPVYIKKRVKLVKTYPNGFFNFKEVLKSVIWAKKVAYNLKNQANNIIRTIIKKFLS